LALSRFESGIEVAWRFNRPATRINRGVGLCGAWFGTRWYCRPSRAGQRGRLCTFGAGRRPRGGQSDGDRPSGFTGCRGGGNGELVGEVAGVQVGGGFYQVSEDVGSLAGADVVDDLQARSV
jgi:hypothetical protein